MLKSSLVVNLATLLVSLVGFVNQIVLAKLFGASISMDAYLISLSAPMLVSGIVSAGIGYTTVPAMMIHKSNLEEYRRFSGLLLISLTAISAAISIAGFLAAPAQIAILGASLPSATQRQAIEIARLAWITAGVMIVAAYFKAVHNAANRLLLATAAGIVPFLTMIAAGLLFADSFGPVAVAWGMLLGFLLVIPLLWLHARSDIEISAKCLRLAKSVAEYLSRAPLILLAMLCFTVFQSIDAYWAPQIGTGNLAYLGYCHRLLVAIGNLLIVGPSAAILPRLAAAHADGRIDDLLRDSLRALRMVFVIAVPIALAVSVLATPIVQILFERGAFDHRATQAVAALLPPMMFGMAAMLCIVIVCRALFARHDNLWASMLGIFTTVLYFFFSAILSKKMGATGIALSYALTWWLMLALSIVILWRGHLDLFFRKETGLFVGRIAVLTGLTGAVLTVGAELIKLANTEGWMLLFLLGIVAVTVTGCFLFLAIRALRLEEIRLLYAFLISKLALLRHRT